MNPRINTREDFDAFFRRFFAEARLSQDRQVYFHQSVDRLWATARAFDLFSSAYEDLLEIGPGFAFLPFLWKAAIARRVAILDGESFELLEFGETYRRFDIEARFADLFRLFAERDPARNRLPFESERFDGVICWETIEHFNFNPLPFLHELRRVVRKGGRVNLTVPNQANLDLRLALMRGRSVRTPIRDYVLQMDDRNCMKYAPHWREYTLGEFREILEHAGFRILKASHLHTFKNLDSLGLGRRLKRRLGVWATRLIPSFSSLCVVQATKD